MNISDKTRSYIWLTFAVLSFICAISRIVDLVQGDKEWWHLVTTLVITALCTKYFFCYRKKARAESGMNINE